VVLAVHSWEKMRIKMEMDLVVDRKEIKDRYLMQENVFDHHLKKMVIVDVEVVVVIIMMNNPSK
jgi:hypothetical protein